MKRVNKLKQRVRTSVLFGHFSKWYLGHGDRCPWCRACVKFPILQRVISYSYEGAGFCENCEMWTDYPPGYDWLDDPAPPCAECGEKIY